MDHLLVVRDKIGRLREEIAAIQNLNEQFRRDGVNGAQVQVAHGKRMERLQAIQQELVQLADLGRKVVSTDQMREKHRTRLHLVKTSVVAVVCIPSGQLSPDPYGPFRGHAFAPGLPSSGASHRAQVIGVALYFLDNVLRLDFALEPPQGTLDRLTFLQSNLCQIMTSKLTLIKLSLFGPNILQLFPSSPKW